MRERMRSPHRSLRWATYTMLLLLTASAAHATPPVFQKGGVALGGYDPVAYFTDSAPVEGDDRYTHDWNGATWYFSSEENRNAFAAEPERYAPRYGGYCAYAVSQGYTAKTEPDAWTIHEGALYLNYNRSVMAKWRRDKESYIAQANDNWPAVLDE